MKSISGGERQSYGSSPSSFNRPLTAPIWLGFAPDSMIEDTNAAKVGAAQPFSFESSVWIKSNPYRGWFLFSMRPDRKSTRLNSSHSQISYAVFCLKKKK